mmetsp:Transcript_23290/g.38327  ORF Transcript_23290/g.38327 Transcript_23290/m.38327 type:complete len:109 (-) Transcript_23290:209-535(-)
MKYSNFEKISELVKALISDSCILAEQPMLGHGMLTTSASSILIVRYICKQLMQKVCRHAGSVNDSESREVSRQIGHEKVAEVVLVDSSSFSSILPEVTIHAQGQMMCR